MSRSMCAFLLLFSFEALASTPLTDIWKNNQATDHLNQKKPLEAHEEFVQLLSDEPFHPLYRFNMGSSFIAIEQVDKALKMYNEVLKLQPLPPEVEFATYYNLGFLNSLDGRDVNKALDNYQKALKMNPDSIEIKTNIELLFKGGKGGGKGEKEQDEDKQDKDGEQPQEPEKFTNKPQNNQFNDKEMSKGDVKKILEELKKQEQSIRAKHERKGKKEAPRDKDW